MFKKKPQTDIDSTAKTAGDSGDYSDVMRKYDKESNTRIWEGKAGTIIKYVMALFSVYCMYSTLFSVEALLACSEHELIAAFLADQGLVRIDGLFHIRIHNFIFVHGFLPRFEKNDDDVCPSADSHRHPVGAFS